MSNNWALRTTPTATRASSERRVLTAAAITFTVVAVLLAVTLVAITARPVSIIVASPLLGLALVAAYLRARIGWHE